MRFDHTSLRLGRMGGSGGFGAIPSLNSGLVSYWPLATDGRNLAASNHLTNVNGVTFVAKGVGAPANMPATVASFTPASLQYMVATSPAGTAINAPRTMAIWANVASTALTTGVCTYGNTAIETTPLVLFQQNNNTLRHYHAGTYAGDIAVALGWHFIIFTSTGSSSVTFRVDANTEYTSAANDSVGTNFTNFYIGVGYSTYWDNTLSSCMIWNRVLSAAERTALYNGGAGLFY